MSRPRSLAAALALLALLPATSRADDLGDAQVLLDQGRRAVAARDDATAVDRFREAYARYPSPAVLPELGAALRRQGRDPEAAVVYERFLRDPGPSGARVAEVRRALAEIDAAVARVTVSADDPSARVWIDGAFLEGFAPGGMLRLAPGEHTVAVGHEAPLLTETIRVAPGEARSVFLRVPAASPLPPGPPGILPPRPPSGMAPAGEPEPPEAYEAPPRRRSGSMNPVKGVAITFDVLGGLGIATGFGLGIAALVIDFSASDHCLDRGAACEPRALELQNQARTFGRAGGIVAGAGGGLLVTGLILGAVARSLRDGAGPARARVALGPGFVGLEGSW